MVSRWYRNNARRCSVVEAHGTQFQHRYPGDAHRFQQLLERQHLLSPVLACRTALVERLLHRLQIRQRQLCIDHPISDSGSTRPETHHIIILEAAHHMADGIGLANIAQELVAQPSPRSACDQPGDIHKTAVGTILCGLTIAAITSLARIRQWDDADIWIDGAKRVVLSGNLPVSVH